jgi:nucleoid DNA-binding protein
MGQYHFRAPGGDRARSRDSLVAELKTTVTKASVGAFLKSVDDAQKRRDSREVMALMKEITGKQPRMWGSSIIGFGSYHYRYQSGREGDWPVTGLSPRKQNLTIYIMPGFERYAPLMKKLGKYKTGKSCLYVKKLEDVDCNALRELIARSVADMEKMYDCT